MFNQDVEQRLNSWLELRKRIEVSENPLENVWDFFQSSPFTPYNRKINPYNPQSWPTPWEIVADNVYDDFTKALIISQTLKMTKRFRNSAILIKTILDLTEKIEYNLVYIEDTWVINYCDNGPITIDEMTSSFEIENIVEVTCPR